MNMNSNKSSIPSSLFIAGAPDGCGFWRMFLPSRATAGASFLLASQIQGKLAPEVQVVVCQRQTSRMNYIAIEHARARGMRVIQDLDDDLWSIPTSNPNCAAVRSQLPWLERCLAVSDLITVSTPILGQEIQKRGFRPVHIIENGIDLKMFAPVNPPRIGRKKVKIGWPGSATHDADGQVAMEELLSLMCKYRNVECEFTGGMPKPMADAMNAGLLDSERVTISSVSAFSYPNWLRSRDWDFMIAPLEDNPFNRAKSWLKFLEAGSLRIPCLGSDVGEYRRFCHGSLERLLCCTRDDWRNKLESFINWRFTRVGFGEEVYDEVRSRHQMCHRASQWESAIYTAHDQPTLQVDQAELNRIVMEEIEARNLTTALKGESQ